MKSFKFLLGLLLVLGVLVFPHNDASAARVDSKKITSIYTTFKGKVGGTTKVCLRAKGWDWFYNPYVTFYQGKKTVKGKKLKAGQCISFNAGKTATRTYRVEVSRLSVPGTFYFDLHS